MKTSPRLAAVQANWNDLRFFVVTAREKTLAAASRRLGVDPTTVARRLHGLEESLGAPLFERDEGRLRLTPFGRGALERALRIEEDVASVVRSAEAEARAVRGTVRITAVGVVTAEYLVPRLPELYALHPEVVLDFVDSDDNLNLSRREADVAIRVSRPESGDFVMRKLATIAFAVYERGRGARPKGWVAYGDHLAHVPEMRWLAEHAAGAPIRLRDDSARALVRGVAAGIGRGLLPCFVGDAEPGVRRSSHAGPLPTRDLWLLVHREARGSARVAVVVEWLARRFAADAALFAGRSSGRRVRRSGARS